MADEKHSTRVAIISALVSFFLSVVFAAYIVGQRTGKLLEIDHWRKEVAPQIQRMDLEGSVATKNFINQYEKEQAKQYERLKHLEDEVNHLDKMELRIDRLEKR